MRPQRCVERSASAAGVDDATTARRSSTISTPAALPPLIVSVNVLPAPGVEPTVMSPPNSAARRWLIASPSPVPPKRRVIELSACVNGWKSRPICSASIPMPLSSIEKERMLSTPRRTHDSRTPTVPLPVNLIALPTRFTRIWRSRSGSVRTVRGIGVATTTSQTSPFSDARGRMSETTSPTSCGRSQLMFSTVILPASIFEMSRMSLIRSIRCRALRRIVWRWSWRSESVCSGSSIISE